MTVFVRNGRLLWPLRFGAFLVVAAVIVALAMRFDRSVFDLIHNPEGIEPWFYAAVRQLGEIWTWLIAVPLVMLADQLWRTKRSVLASFERSLFILWAPMFAGLASTILKLLVRRERPDAHAGAYVFRAWRDHTWDTSGLGFPSGHASVAFGAAWMLAMMYPRLAPLWLLGAALCGLSRLMTQAHFFSDVVAGCMLGFGSAWLFWTMYKTWCEGREPVTTRALHAMRRQGSMSPAK